MSEIKHLWLIRHGESKAQTQEEFSFDANLSELGKKQAAALSKAFAADAFDIAYVSPLKRARQTFELSGVKPERVIFDSRILEDVPQDSYAALLPYEKLPAYGLPDIHNAWLIDMPYRIAPFMEDVYKCDADNIAVFAHAGVMSCILNCFLMHSYFKPDEFRKYRYSLMNNCAVSVFRLGPNPEHNILHKWNSTEHLESLEQKK